MKLSPNDLLKPVFTGHDAAVFVSSKTSAQAVAEQFFRAAAIKSFEELKPPPAFSEITEILPGRPRSEAVTMLLVVVEGDHVQTEFLRGDPNQAVMFKRPPETPLKPFGRIQEQTTGARGNIIFAAAPADQPTDLALYCLCDGQIIRLTSPEEFSPITRVANGKSISSLVSDSQHTTAFIDPGVDGSDSGAIYVTSVP
jgi:N-acetylmuramoyl-L-alanine amidase